jgi:hypothetical protein
MRTISSPRRNSQSTSAPLANLWRMQAWLARVARRSALGEIGRRRGGDVALDARPDGNRDHVALDALLVADAGVEAGGQHVDKRIVGRDLERHARMGQQEAGDNGGEDFLGDDRRHIEPQRSPRSLAKAVHHVQRARSR